MKTTPSNPLARVARTFLVAILLLSGGLRGVAQIGPGGQAGQAAPALQVGSLAVRFVGTANVSEDVVRANIQMRSGGAVDDTIIGRDIRSLYRTGLFEFIEVFYNRHRHQEGLAHFTPSEYADKWSHDHGEPNLA